MNSSITLTEAKAKLSEIVNHIVYEHMRVTITKKGKDVAMILPIGDYHILQAGAPKGLIAAQGALADLDDELDRFASDMYQAREHTSTRAVKL